MAATTPIEPDTVAATAPVTGFSHIQLLVSDVPTSERWYTTVLGLERLTVAADGRYVALRHRPSRAVVVLTAGAPTRDGDRLDHLAFAVPDGPALVAWAARLSELGVQHPGVVDELGKPSLTLRDPDGIPIELVAPAGSWG
jgi:catechol-2,3-dioxygenase